MLRQVELIFTTGLEALKGWMWPWTYLTPVFLNRRAAAQYRALASVIPGREGREEIKICYKISLVQWLITNLNIILYLSTCNTVYISVLIHFVIMP